MPPRDAPSATRRSVSRARPGKSTAGAGERLDTTDAPGAAELPIPALRISNAVQAPAAVRAPDPAPERTERPATDSPAVAAADMPAARFGGNAVARKRASVMGSAPGDGEPPIGDPPGTAPTATDRPVTAGPADEDPRMPAARFRGNAVARKHASVAASAASDANPPAPTSRPPSAPSSPTTIETSTPLPTPASSRGPGPATAATEAPAAIRVTTDAPTQTGAGADPAALVSSSPLPTAAATKGVARRSVARATAARSRRAVEATAGTPGRRETPGWTDTPDPTDIPSRTDALGPTDEPTATHEPGGIDADGGTGAPARAPRRGLTGPAVGGPTDRNRRAALSSLRPRMVARRAVPPIQSPGGFDTHERSAASGDTPASGAVPTLRVNTRPLVRAHTRMAGPSAPGQAVATVAAADTATALIRASEPEPTPQQSYLSPASARNRPTGESLARAIGGTRESDGSGGSTVVFPQPPGRGTRPGTSGSARLLARETIDLEPASLNGHGPGAVPTAAVQPSMYDSGEFEELYDRVLSRLRRELIVERERRGDLAGAYFR